MIESRTAPPGARAVASQVGLSLVVFGLAFGLLQLGHPTHPLHDDTYEDLLLARACVEQSRCHAVGVSTSLGDVEQGALWVNLLSALRAQSLPVSAIHSFTFALAASGVALLFLFLWRRGPLDTAAVAAALLAAALLLSGSLGVLWNPSLIPLCAVLLFATSVHYADVRKHALLLPLGLALGLALETHPIAALAAPGALLVAGLFAPSRRAAWVTPTLTGLIALALYAAISPVTAYRNVERALEIGTPGLLSAALLSVTLAAVYLRERLGDGSPRRRAVTVAVALAAPIVLLAPLGSLVVQGAQFGPRYLFPVLPAIVFLVAAGFTAIVSDVRVRVGFAALLVGAVVLLWPHRDPTERTMSALEAVQATLEPEGFTLDEAWARVSGPGCRAVIGGLAAVGAPIAGPPVESSGRSTIVVMAAELDRFEGPDAELGRGDWRTIPSADGDVLVGELRTWVGRRRFSACVEVDRAPDGSAEGTEDTEPTCFDADLSRGVRAALAPEGGYIGMTWLESPHVTWQNVQVRLGASRIVYRLPVEVPPDAGRRTVIAPMTGRPDCARARFIRAEGVRLGSELPSSELIVEAIDEVQRGTVELEVDVRECASEPLEVFPPCLSETAADDGPALRHLLVP